jgi:hypothetical protein
VKKEICEGESLSALRSIDFPAERNCEIDFLEFEVVLQRKLELDGGQKKVRFDDRSEGNRTLTRILNKIHRNRFQAQIYYELDISNVLKLFTRDVVNMH